MSMPSVIEVNTERCTGCRECIASCPSPLANFVRTLDDGRKVIDIDPDKCIACGECVKSCTHGGRDYDDDTEKFFKDLGNRKIVIVAHPAIKAAFGKRWQSVLRWFKQNGCDGIYDGAFGADIATWAYCKNADQGTARKVISTHCPAVVRYMEVYHPDEIDCVSTVHSPLSCEAVYIRDYVKKNYAVAALTPCPAMSLEFAETGHVEYNITYKRLREYFRRKRIEFKNITESGMTYDFDDMAQGIMGGLYPFPGGLRENLALNLPSVLAINADGKDGLYKEIDEFCTTPRDLRPDVFEALSCAGGCAFGIGAYDEDEVTPLEIHSIRRRIEIDARSRRKVTITNVDRRLKEIEERVNPRSIVRKFEDLPPKPDKQEIAVRKAELEAFLDESCHTSGAPVPEETAEKPSESVNTAAAETQAEEVQTEQTEEQAAAALRIAQTAVKIKHISDEAANQIGDVVFRTSGIDTTISQAASMASIIESILSKIIGLCQANDSIDEDSLPQLVAILDKLQTAVNSLRSNLSESTVSAQELNEAVKNVSDTVGELQDTANSMILAVAAR